MVHTGTSDPGDWVSVLASYLGASGPALRLLISLLMGYPFALIHRALLYKSNPNLQHVFFILAGSFIGYFNYGSSLLHAYVCILVHFVTVKVTRGSRLGTALVFIFQMGYLLTEYYMTETAMYDIKWTIPHCVLTLRLVGQGFDLYDGTKDPDTLSSEQKITAIRTVPTLLESAGHVFYPGSFMIGPQFPISRYNSFVKCTLFPGNAPDSIGPGVKRLLIGLLYVSIFQVGTLVVNNDYVTSPQYQALPFWLRLLVVGLYGKVMLYKYVSCWIVSEGACILGGISYNGNDSKGISRWDGCENINVSVFERAYKFSHLISSFNKCTNHWVAINVYKRLKFVGSRHVSQGAALLFLAVWHGLHSGYYMCFFMEFLVMNMEKELDKIVSKNAKIQAWHSHPIGFWLDVIILKLLVTVFFGYCTLPFGLLKFNKWWLVYKDLYFIGSIIFGLWPLYSPIVKKLLLPKRESVAVPVVVAEANGVK